MATRSPGQTLVNVTNGKIIRLLVDDEPFDLRYGELLSHERELDLRNGVLRRTVEWVSPAGDGVRVRSTRLVSFAQRAAAAIRYEVEPLDGPVRVVVQSELVANEPAPARSGDPRAAAALDSPLQSEEHSSYENRVVLVHSTKFSKLRLAAAMDHLVDGPDNTETWTETAPDVGRVTIAADLAARTMPERWSSSWPTAPRASAPCRPSEISPSPRSPRRGIPGWDGLLGSQRDVPGRLLEPRRRRAGRRHRAAAGDPLRALPHAPGRRPRRAARHRSEGSHRPRLRRPHLLGHGALRLASTHLHGAAGGRRRPSLAPLHARARTRAGGPARSRRAPRSPGAPFGARSARDTGPPGTAAFHIGADIADAVVRYQDATADAAFEREVGLELLVETARFWRSLGHHDAQGLFRIDGVTGPDEYSAIADNNVYTNLMAQRNLRCGGRGGPAPSAARRRSRAPTSRRRRHGGTRPRT